MEYIIHLTEKCNLNCTYCYENKRNKDISFEDIKNLIDYEIRRKQKYSIIIFYGGEPLLQKNMIKNTIDYINSKMCKTHFYYGITTNGTLLDDDFIRYMKENRFVNIAYSIDGMRSTHDLNRLTIDGKGTFDIVEQNAKKIIKAFDSVVSMSVITRNNLSELSKNVEYLIEMGFKYINLLFDYSQDWKDEDLEQIRKQYNEIAEIYANKILKKYDTEIPLIDEKIKAYIKDEYNCNEECKLGMRTINVGTDGNFYPCMQLVNKLNIKELEEMYEKIKELQIDSWRIVNMDPIGRAQDNSELALEKEDYKYLLNFIKEKKKKSKFDVTYGCTHFVGMNYEKEVRNHMFFCVTGFTTGSILYNGDIYVCPSVERRKELVQGNIRTDDFVEV